MTDRLLVLVRHGQSDWNLKNLFTGWRDVDLTEKGIIEAREAGRKLKAQGIKFDVAFTSALKRAQRTLDLMLTELGQTSIPIFRDRALNERDYGDLVGLNKDDARKKWGEEQVHIWRRSYDVDCLITSRKFFHGSCAASMSLCRLTAIRCARS
jgi:2,3-bisphosphoglycerate-dependent phosphoglycerate mutase